MKARQARQIGWLAALAAAALLLTLALRPPVAAAQCGGPIEAGRAVTARIGRAGEVCNYTFVGKTGDLVAVRMSALDRGLDPLVELRNPSQATIAWSDDTAKSLDSRIPTIRLAAPGTYTISARAADGKGRGGFALLLERSAPISVGARVSGALSAAQPRLRYSFDGRAGASVTIWMETRAAGLDPWLDLEDPSGEVVVSDDDGYGGVNSRIANYRLRGDGIYTIVARSYDEKGNGTFTLGVEAGR